jgi:hypothetical protein
MSFSVALLIFIKNSLYEEHNKQKSLFLQTGQWRKPGKRFTSFFNQRQKLKKDVSEERKRKLSS